MMKPGDFIRTKNIVSSEQLDDIHRWVRMLGYNPNPAYGSNFALCDEYDVLSLDDDGDLVWFGPGGLNNEYTPDDIRMLALGEPEYRQEEIARLEREIAELSTRLAVLKQQEAGDVGSSN